MDKDGNSYKEKAIQNLIDQRNKVKDGGASQQSIDRFISERPIRPAEAVLELGKNIFPRKSWMSCSPLWDGNGLTNSLVTGSIARLRCGMRRKRNGSARRMCVWRHRRTRLSAAITQPRINLRSEHVMMRR